MPLQVKSIFLDQLAQFCLVHPQYGNREPTGVVNFPFTVFLELVDAIWKMIEEEVKAALEMTASGKVESKALATY